MRQQQTILIVDDEQNIRRVLEAAFQKDGYQVLTAAHGHQALKTLQEELVDVMISDVVMPDMNGLDLLKKSREQYPDLTVIMMTAYGTIPSAVDAIRTGALDFLTKPLDLDVLKKLVRNGLRDREKSAQPKTAKRKRKTSVQFVGQSPVIQEVMQMVERVADTRTTVLITGESGTGKELIARMLHEKSSRAGGPFVAVSCAAIPETLLESELFGAVKGAFTGADADRAGRFEMADGGTLFLDEIGDIPALVQVKLLRVLQEREVERLGSSKTIPVDVRLVTATNRNLEEAVQEGVFRGDLYYRLQVVQIELPALRERAEDVPLLAEFFLQKYAAENSRNLQSLHAGALEILQEYQWPGNVRELENAIEHAVVLAPPDATELMAEHLPAQIRRSVG
jgi:two-component system response regulator AtoC